METGIFAAGCFWKPDLEFEKLKGVKKIYYPGEKKAKRFQINSRKGINIPSKILAEINFLNKS